MDNRNKDTDSGLRFANPSGLYNPTPNGYSHLALFPQLIREGDMIARTIRLNHTIVAAHDKDTAAMFLTEILGLAAPSLLGPFAVVRVGDDTSLDYIDADGEITSQHYAFLVSEVEFDEIFERIRERRLSYWADPGRHERDQINTWDGGRGLYFDDPNGHLLEIITRPYGSGGTAAPRPHPLVAPTLDPAAHEGRRSGQQGKTGGRLATAERPDRRDE